MKTMRSTSISIIGVGSLVLLSLGASTEQCSYRVSGQAGPTNSSTDAADAELEKEISKAIRSLEHSLDDLAARFAPGQAVDLDEDGNADLTVERVGDSIIHTGYYQNKVAYTVEYDATGDLVAAEYDRNNDGVIDEEVVVSIVDQNRFRVRISDSDFDGEVDRKVTAIYANDSLSVTTEALEHDTKLWRIESEYSTMGGQHSADDLCGGATNIDDMVSCSRINRQIFGMPLFPTDSITGRRRNIRILRSRKGAPADGLRCDPTQALTLVKAIENAVRSLGLFMVELNPDLALAVNQKLNSGSLLVGCTSCGAGETILNETGSDAILVNMTLQSDITTRVKHEERLKSTIVHEMLHWGGAIHETSFCGHQGGRTGEGSGVDEIYACSRACGACIVAAGVGRYSLPSRFHEFSFDCSRCMWRNKTQARIALCGHQVPIEHPGEEMLEAPCTASCFRIEDDEVVTTRAAKCQRYRNATCDFFDDTEVPGVFGIAYTLDVCVESCPSGFTKPEFAVDADPDNTVLVSCSRALSRVRDENTRATHCGDGLPMKDFRFLDARCQGRRFQCDGPHGAICL